MTIIFHSLKEDNACQGAFNYVPVVRMALASLVSAVHNSAQDGEALQFT